MLLLEQGNATKVILFLMVDSTDHVTPKTGLSPTVTISKNGGAFGSPAGTTAEVGNGWYKLTPTAADTNTQGGLILHATGTAADPADVYCQVLLADQLDSYQAKVWIFNDVLAVTDRYSIIYFKNAQPVTSGITSPTIQVIKATDGSDLIASTALTQVASTGLYKYDATGANLIVLGASYIAKVQATIDGATRSWYQPVGRDST